MFFPRLSRSVLACVCVFVLLTPNISVGNAEAAGRYFLDIWPEMDTFVSEEGRETTYGLNQSLKSGYWQGFEMAFYHSCILLKFNLSLLPADAVIVDAYLILYLYQGGGRTLELMRVAEPWDHRTACWNNRPKPVYPSPGANVTWTVDTVYSEKSYNVTSWAIGWWEESYPNYGLTVRPYPWNTVGNICWFYSQEGASVDPDEEMRAIKMPKLRVSYVASAPVPQPDPPEPPPWIDDVVPPTISLSVSPAGIIRPTDTITFSVTARDDKCLDSVILYVDSIAVEKILVPYAELSNTSITIEYSVSLSLGAHHVLTTAEDRMSHLVGEYRRVWVGSYTPPEVMIWCSPEKVLPGDGTTIEVTVEVSDPEGLKSVVVGVENAYYNPSANPGHSQMFNFAEPYPTSYRATLTFPNKNVPNMRADPLNATQIMCGVRATDAELLTANAWDQIEVVRPYQWDYGIPYPNQNNPDLSWQRYEDAFGHGELWGPGELEWWHTIVARFWEPVFSMMAANGECFGMSMYSLWHYYNGVPVPDSLTEHVGDEEAPYLPGYEEWRYAKRTIEKFQGAQISQELLTKYIDQVMDELRASRTISPFLAGPFQRMLQDLQNGRPGILYVAEYRGLDQGVTECVGAHAIVPYFARELSDGVWQVYVYDCNRNAASTCFCSDLDNYEHYPYVIVSESGFEWHQLIDSSTDPPTTELWNDFIWYLSYHDALRDDYDLIDGWLVTATVLLMVVVTATTLALAAPVLITVEALCPIPLPLPMGKPAPMQSIALPAGEQYTVNFTGREEGEYTWAMASGYSNYGIQNKTCNDGSRDVLILEISDECMEYGLRFKGDLPDNDFMMGMMHRVGTELREYSLENISMGADGDLETYATADGDSLVIANRGDSPVTLKVLLRSSRDVGEARKELTVEPGQKVTITANWDDLTAPLSVVVENLGETKQILYVTIIVSAIVVVLAVVVTAFLRRRKRGEVG
ncbi:MAG: DNRLRE domain-containing protein [Thermoplasmata archaeon]